MFQGQILGSADESRDLELAAADTDVTDPGPPSEDPPEGGNPKERKIFNKANLKKALLLGGIALLFTFTEQIEKALSSINIKLYDHLIITYDKHFSFAGNGLL